MKKWSMFKRRSEARESVKQVWDGQRLEQRRWAVLVWSTSRGTAWNVVSSHECGHGVVLITPSELWILINGVR